LVLKLNNSPLQTFKRVIEGSFMMIFFESTVLWLATFFVGLALFYIAEKFEGHDKSDVDV